MDDAEERHLPTDNEGEALQGADECSAAKVQSDVSATNDSQTSSLPQTYACIYMTVLPCETGFDSEAQAIVHWSVDALPKRDPTTFEASQGMEVFDNETQSFWVTPSLRT